MKTTRNDARSRGHRAAASPQRGMTLIEILVVLVLIGGIVFSILMGVMGMSELVL